MKSIVRTVDRYHTLNKVLSLMLVLIPSFYRLLSTPIEIDDQNIKSLVADH